MGYERRLTAAGIRKLAGVEGARRGVSYWGFGTVVAAYPRREDDDRRWMVLQTGALSHVWLLMSLSDRPIISSWSSMFGFQRVDE